MKILSVIVGVVALSLGQASSTMSPGLIPASQPRLPTLADRIAYQRAIEEVYWRHRIWPKERRDPKPSLDQVMSEAQLERKVEDYLRNSRAVEDYWQRPITAERLQAEMDRMAMHTKAPEVLRELFESLGNDPFVIAECLARPVLAERLGANFYAHAQGFHGEPGPSAESWRAKAENQMAKVMAATTANYTLPIILDGVGCTDNTWTATTTTNAPSARYADAAVWTGGEMIVWGGFSGGTSYLNTGGRYNQSADSWTATSTISAPSGRYSHTAVWTGSEMIVWGGYGNSGELNTGGRYNPSTDSWTATSTTSAPSARRDHTAVWTGSEMIVWGGLNGGSTYLNTGGRYNPSTDSWTATTTTSAPSARDLHTAVWTGSEMIVWGGFSGGTSYLNTGGRYDPGADSWTATSTISAPAPRDSHKAVWTGSEMILWGGFSGGNNVNTGGRYNPNTNSWTATRTTGAPSARADHTVVWTGGEMIVWGGFDGSYTNTGGRYNPSTDSWTATTNNSAPAGRLPNMAVWTGTEMIVWGGFGSGGFFDTGGRYCAQVQAPTVQSAVSRKTHGGAGAFDVNLPLTGTAGVECRASGGTNDYTMVITFAGNVTVTGSPQAQLTMGTGCVGSGGVCTGNVSVSGNVVTIPLTTIANVQTINVRLNGVNNAGAAAPATDFNIPMSILIGDTNGNRTVNAADVAQTKGRLGQTINVTNFRSDVNANGSINAADPAIIKQNSGTSLPP